MSTNDPVRRAFDQRVAGYVGLGWVLVQQQTDPPRAWLVYRQPRRGRTPQPNEVSDTGERVIWVDDTGEIRVDRVGQ
jgi:hypothetical protein